MHIFCPGCSAYFPAGAACPVCKRARPLLLTPPAPGAALWQATLPGSIGARMAHAVCGGRDCLLVPWYHDPQGADERPPDGGLAALDLATGDLVWTCPLGAPAEGGVAVSGGIAYVGTGLRRFGAGEGQLAAVDTGDGALLWRVSIAGAVHSTPAYNEARVYVTAGDGALHSVAGDERTLARVPIADRPVRMPADPVAVHLRGATLLLAASYGASFGRVPAAIAAVNSRGERLWREAVPGSVRGTPAVAGERVYVTAFLERPSGGQLHALSVRSGASLWPAPFTVQAAPGERTAAGFSAGALVHAGTVYVGSLNHRLYALDAATGALQWQAEAEAGIAATPAWVEGLVVFGANDGALYAVDGGTGELIWRHPLDGRILTEPLVVNGAIFVGTDAGTVAALPWHGGRYAWAAERLAASERRLEAGDHHAMVAYLATDPQQAESDYRKASDTWRRAGAPQRAGELWFALDRPAEAADAFYEAGLRLRYRAPERAESYFARAAYQYTRLGDCERLNQCTRALSRCAGLPFIRVRPLQSALVQWEAGRLTLELSNDGAAPLEQALMISLGGTLPEPLGMEIAPPLAVGESRCLPLTITPVAEENRLEVEIVYGAPGYPTLRGLFVIPLHAAARPRPPLQIGDVASLQVLLPQTTTEGVAIHARDVGQMRSETSGDVTVHAEGDIGAVIRRPARSDGGHCDG